MGRRLLVGVHVFEYTRLRFNFQLACTRTCKWTLGRRWANARQRISQQEHDNACQRISQQEHESKACHRPGPCLATFSEELKTALPAPEASPSLWLSNIHPPAHIYSIHLRDQEWRGGEEGAHGSSEKGGGVGGGIALPATWRRGREP